MIENKPEITVTISKISMTFKTIVVARLKMNEKHSILRFFFNFEYLAGLK